MLSKLFGSYTFEKLWENEWKIHISIVFFHDIFENQLYFLDKWKKNLVMSIQSYLFPMNLFLLKLLFFQYSLTLNPKSDRKFDVSYIPNKNIRYMH